MAYLCLHRVDVARQSSHTDDGIAVRTLAIIGDWALRTRTGDLAELPGLDERSPVVPLVTSSRNNCLGSQCPRFRDCHVNQARRAALAADVVVVNHHLFFADLTVRESGMAELLPSVRTIIFDEAHQLNETGVQFLGEQLGTGQLLEFARDMVTSGLQLACGLFDWGALASDTECVARDLRMVVGKTSPGVKLRWSGSAPEQVISSEWNDAFVALRASCSRAMLALEIVSEIAPDLARLHERSKAIVKQLDHFSGACSCDSVRWLDVGMQLRLVESPFDISQAFQGHFVQSTEIGSLRRSWIFTSATLGDDARLSWFTEPCGLLSANVLRVGSPFDYARQGALYVPKTMVKPGAPAHSAQVADLVARLAAVVGGRTLVLTTTLRALESVGAALQKHFADSTAIEILLQGQKPKRELIARFRMESQTGQAGCVLVASASFWQGLDVPGESLQLVVIDKLPFPPPSEIPWWMRMPGGWRLRAEVHSITIFCLRLR